SRDREPPVAEGLLELRQVPQRDVRGLADVPPLVEAVFDLEAEGAGQDAMDLPETRAAAEDVGAFGEVSVAGLDDGDGEQIARHAVQAGFLLEQRPVPLEAAESPAHVAP